MKTLKVEQYVKFINLSYLISARCKLTFKRG